MKITKRQLRRIIKEELRHLAEYGSRYGDQGERVTADMNDEEKEWFQKGVEAGSHRGSGYDDMPHPTTAGGAWYDAWVLGFEHAKSGGY